MDIDLVIKYLQLPTKTRTEWVAWPTILRDGELVVEIDDTTGKKRLVAGDGATPYEGLGPLGETGTERIITATIANGGISINDQVTIGTIATNAAALEKLISPYVAPTITNTVLTISLLEWNDINKSIGVAFKWQKNTGTANFVSGQIKYKRSNDSTWSDLTTAISDSGNDKIASGTLVTDGTINNNAIQFKVVFVDANRSNESSVVSTTFRPYANPSVSGFSVGATTDEKGNTSRTISGTIVRNSPNISLVSAQLYVRTNAGAWSAHGAAVALSGASQAISIPYDGSTNKDANTIEFRFYITDAQGITNNATSSTVTFYYRYFFTNTTKDGTTQPILDSDILTASGYGTITELRTSRQRMLTTFGGGSRRLMFALPYSAGDPSFKINALPNSAFTTVRDNSDFTNQHGLTYKVKVVLSNNTYASPLDSVEVL